jgi:hypothetical protein
MSRHFDPLVDRFIAVLQKALPGCPAQEVYWGDEFLTGAGRKTAKHRQRAA